MRSLLFALITVAGCRASTSGAPETESLSLTPVAQESPLPNARSAGADRATEADLAVDSLGRDAWGVPVSADSFHALAAAVDTTVSGTVEIIGRAGTYHAGEVTAQPGARWQGLYPSASGVEVRSLRLGIDTVPDGIVDGPGDPPSGVRVTTPFSQIEEDWVEDDVLALVRRPGSPFPPRPATVLAGSWPIASGRLVLALGGRQYALEVVEGPETVWMPQRERGRPDRVLVIAEVDGVRQPISDLSGGDAGSPEVRWAGDLDGDGRLDLVVDETNHYNLSAPALFLSSEARPGTLVRRAARMESVGC